METKMNVQCIYRFMSYLTESSMFQLENHSVKAVYGSGGCLLWEFCGTQNGQNAVIYVEPGSTCGYHWSLMG
jgi:predicted secreted protein